MEEIRNQVKASDVPVGWEWVLIPFGLDIKPVCQVASKYDGPWVYCWKDGNRFLCSPVKETKSINLPQWKTETDYKVGDQVACLHEAFEAVKDHKANVFANDFFNAKLWKRIDAH